MAWTADRDTVAMHAAARSLLLLENFRRAAENVEMNIWIRPLRDGEPGYSVNTTVSWPDRRPQDIRSIEEGRGRDDVIREVALYVINDAAEDVTTGLSDEDRARAMSVAYDRTAHFVRCSLEFSENISDDELRGMAQEAFDLAVNLLTENKDEFDNLTQVFRRRDHLEGRKTIEVAAWTGLAPAAP